MLKPVSLLALDDVAATLADAVQSRIAARSGLEDLAQSRVLSECGGGLQPAAASISPRAQARGHIRETADLAQALQSIHAQRQRPDSPLRMRDDVSKREVILMLLCAAGPARGRAIDLARDVRQLYERRRFASAFTIELIVLLPEVTGASDYASAYGLLKALSAAEPKPFDQVWLVDATNAQRVRFGALDADLDVYADAIAGALTYEPEMSGAFPGSHPRGMHPTFSSFGYAELTFPRDAALQRIESRFASELVADVLLSRANDERVPAPLRAKQFVVADAFALPVTRIGVDAGQSLFKRFQAKAVVSGRTRNIDEHIAAVRNELQAFRDHTHLQNLEQLARQAEGTSGELTMLVARTVDETLDRESYGAAVEVLDALVDPLPDLRADAEASARNLSTAVHESTAALDARLRFTPNTLASDGSRKRIRELDELLDDQKAMAETLAPVSAADQLAQLESERAALHAQLPETLFAEEAENNVARTAAREAEAARLGDETRAKETQLRELFAQKPRAEQALAEALEARRAWLWRQIVYAGGGLVALYALAYVFGVNVNRFAGGALVLFAIFAAVRYWLIVVPMVRAAREALARLVANIELTDRAKNGAYNDELQFEYDVAHRRATIRVLRGVRDFAKLTLDALRARVSELEEMSRAFAPGSIASRGLTLSIIDDADVDAWYERTSDDRKPFVREFPIARSESRRLALEELRTRVITYAASAFDSFRSYTLASAANNLANNLRLTQTLKRFAETSGPLIELRDDDLPAQQTMQRDVTMWLDTSDEPWLAQIQRRLRDAHLKASPDALSVHAVTRVLHFPGYVLGQIDYYRAEYESRPCPDFADVPDLLPTELAVTGALRAAYEQVLLARALGIIDIDATGALSASGIALGDTTLAAAEHLASPAAAPLRAQLDAALTPRLAIARDVTHDLEQLTPLTPLDRGIVAGLVKRYGVEF